MKKIILSLLALGALALPSQASFSWLLQSSTGQPLQVVAGDTFSLTLTLTSTAESVVGYDDFLETFLPAGSPEPSGKGLFTLIARSFAGSQFSFANITDTALLGSSGFALPDATPPTTAQKDLGADRNSNTPLAPGTYQLALYTFRVASTAATGTYNIRTAAGSSVSSGTGAIPTDTTVASTSAPVKVTAAPEPASALLGLCGLAALGARRRRRSVGE